MPIMWRDFEQVFKALEAPEPRWYESPDMEKHASKLPTTWEKYQANAKLTANLDFGCGIDAKGNCRNNRHDTGDRQGKNCCGGCAMNFGYLCAIPPGTADEYRRMFDYVDGFWRAGQGCILPREMRSPTCLTYACYWPTGPKFDTHKLIQLGKMVPRKEAA